METDTAPEILDREKRKQIWFELVVVLGLIWVAVAYAGLQEFLTLSRPRATVQSEIYGTFHRLAEALLPIVLFLRAREPLAKLGLRRLTDKDVRLTAGLIVFMVLYHFGLTLYRPLFLHSPDAYNHASIKGLGPVWVEALVFISAAFFEEIFQRAYICSRLIDLRVSPTATILISALLFAIPHIYQGWAPLPGHFVLGVVFAWAFLRYRSLWPLVAAHALYNIWITYGPIHF